MRKSIPKIPKGLEGKVSVPVLRKSDMDGTNALILAPLVEIG